MVVVPFPEGHKYGLRMMIKGGKTYRWVLTNGGYHFWKPQPPWGLLTESYALMAKSVPWWPGAAE